MIVTRPILPFMTKLQVTCFTLQMLSLVFIPQGENSPLCLAQPVLEEKEIILGKKVFFSHSFIFVKALPAL